MDTKDTSKTSGLTKEDIAEVIVEEVQNSQNPWNTDSEFNPLLSQSQPGTSSEIVSATRKRGRPSRGCLQQLKPIRESKREKKCPTVLKYESFQEPSSEWSEEDKKMLQAGLWEVGIENIAGLQGFLPHKSEKEIENEIAYWKSLANKKLAESLASDEDFEGIPADVIKNLDDWIQHFKESAKASGVSQTAVSYYFAIFAEYGELPSPEESGGVDYRAIYRFIHCMMNGLPPYGLNRVTVKELIKILDSVDKKLGDPILINTLEDRLFSLPHKPDEKKYGRSYESKSKNASGIEQLLTNPVINPLGIPKHFLTRPVIDNDESDDD